MTNFKLAKGVLAGLVVTSASLAAFAQSSTTSPSGVTQAPTGVGVSPQTATEANRQAVPRSDTGTVVRTGPDAVDSARNAASAAAAGSGATTNSGSSTGSTMGTGAGSVMGTGTGMGTGTTMRPAKADRN